jgi:hypothetical protein
MVMQSDRHKADTLLSTEVSKENGMKMSCGEKRSLAYKRQTEMEVA